MSGGALPPSPTDPHDRRRVGPIAVALSPGGGGTLRLAAPAILLLAGAAGWWWSLRMAADMAAMAAAMPDMAMADMVSLAGFLFGWVAMMGAMMLPAMIPVVRLYALAAGRGGVAPLPFFLSGYLVVWTLPGLPAYFAWRWLDGPLGAAAPWAARLAGLVLVAAAVWQFTPWKAACLRHCRSPLSFFLAYGGGARRPRGALKMGAAHGWFCFGCCWAMMAVLVALGTMNLTWMLALSLLILLEKNGPGGRYVAAGGALVFALAGMALLWDPGIFAALRGWAPIR